MTTPAHGSDVYDSPAEAHAAAAPLISTGYTTTIRPQKDEEGTPTGKFIMEYSRS